MPHVVWQPRPREVDAHGLIDAPKSGRAVWGYGIDCQIRGDSICTAARPPRPVQGVSVGRWTHGGGWSWVGQNPRGTLLNDPSSVTLPGRVIQVSTARTVAPQARQAWIFEGLAYRNTSVRPSKVAPAADLQLNSEPGPSRGTCLCPVSGVTPSHRGLRHSVRPPRGDVPDRTALGPKNSDALEVVSSRFKAFRGLASSVLRLQIQISPSVSSKCSARGASSMQLQLGLTVDGVHVLLVCADFASSRCRL
jgi:hypothetical protein